ncbi:MAG: hypothetical protein AAFO89_11850 [Planctomycetota bacterium]
MMRELVESRSVVAVIVGLYVLATIGAIPVPAFVLTRAASDDACVSVCKCTSCSPSSCCCAMLEPVSDGDKDGGPNHALAMFGYSCQPTVTWFIAILPPAVEGAALSGVDSLPFVERAPPAVVHGAESDMGVPTPPPRRSA